MEKIGIRDVRAPRLRELAGKGELAAITDNRVLVGIFCPVTQDWLTHVLTMNQSRLEQSLRGGEKELADRANGLPTLGDIEAAPLADEWSSPGPSNPFEAVSGVVSAVIEMGARTGLAVAERTGIATGLAVANREQHTQHTTVGIADLDGKTIRDAAQDQQTLAVTDRRELIGIIVPVGERFLAHVVDMNLSRIEANIVKGNQELRAGRGRLLDELAADEADAPEM